MGVRGGEASGAGALRILGAVPLSTRKNAKGGEQSAQLADAQTSAACPPTHFPASQEEARLPAQSVRARRLTGAVCWREQRNFEIALYFENSLDCVLVVQGRGTEGRNVENGWK